MDKTGHWLIITKKVSYPHYIPAEWKIVKIFTKFTIAFIPPIAIIANMEKDQIALFKGKKIRRTLYKKEWYFVVIDVIEALTDSD